MLTCLLTTILTYGLPLFYSLRAVKMGNGAPEENKKWAIYWLASFVLFPVFYVVSFFGCTITTIVRVLISVWMYHPSFQGCLFIDHVLKPHLNQRGNQIDKILNMAPLNLLKLTEQIPVVKTE